MRSIRGFVIVAVALGALAGTGQGARADLTEKQVFSWKTQVPMPVSLNAVRVTAAPRATDTRYYDVKLTVAGQPQPMISVFTGNAAYRPAIDQELVKTSPALAEASFSVRYLYDATKTVCAAAVGGTCAAGLPFDPTSPAAQWQIDRSTFPWTITFEGEAPSSKAELVIELVLGANGQQLTKQVVRIPFVGQLAAIAPQG